jgi:hypothetical protein
VVSQLTARSIGRPVWERLGVDSLAGQVVAVQDRSCVLGMSDGDLAILVLADIGDGPLNIVVDGKPGAFAAVEARTPAWFAAGRLQVGRLEVMLDGPAVWESRPDWDRLRSCREAVQARLSLLRTLALQQAPKGSLLVPLLERRVPRGPCGTPMETMFATALEAAMGLRAGWQGDPISLQRGASRLAGLGSGLTPAGDDFMCGAMVWAWLAHPAPGSFCRPLLEAAVRRTTTLSAAFLRVAARGECSVSWHGLLAALAGWRREQAVAANGDGLGLALRDVLSYGSTSGGDTLAGFLWMGGSSEG